MEKAIRYEQATDDLQSEITQYVIELSQRELSPSESQEIPVLLHSVNDIERIGDHAKNLAEIAYTKIDQDVVFSDQALNEITLIKDELFAMLFETKDVLAKGDTSLATNLLDRENRINELHAQLKDAHIERLNKGVCQLKSNFIFLDLIENLEKIADYLTNINQGVIGKMQWRAHKKVEPLVHPT